jgi:large subunit ribosomal protein L29
MAIGSKDLTMEKLDSLDNERIVSEISKSKEELFNLRFSAATGQLENHGRFKELKKDIARLKTILRERELDIRTAPSTFESDNTKSSDKNTNKSDDSVKKDKTDKKKKSETSKDIKSDKNVDVKDKKTQNISDKKKDNKKEK